MQAKISKEMHFAFATPSKVSAYLCLENLFIHCYLSANVEQVHPYLLVLFIFAELKFVICWCMLEVIKMSCYMLLLTCWWFVVVFSWFDG